jgi:hypothetical protein
MRAKEKAAPGATPRTASKSNGDATIVYPVDSRRQFFQDSFGKFLTVLIAAADHAGNDGLVDSLLARKSAWLRRGRA